MKRLIVSFLFIINLGFATTINVPADSSTIQGGINGAVDGDTVLVAAGTYVENINFNGKNIAVIGENRETTIIDGDSSGTVVTFENGENSTAALSGFTIQNGSDYSGGGMYLYNASPTLTNIIISNNTTSFSDGGGMYVSYSNPTLTNVTISNNTARKGGGIYLVNFNPTLTNVRIINNTASDEGGGMFLMIANPTLTNVSIINNTASDEGGGIYCGNSCNPSLVNCVLWNDSPDEIVSTATVTYSNIQGGWEGLGNIDLYPLFCNPDDGVYSLEEYSPCLATGLDGNNMGAYGIGCSGKPEIIAINDVPNDQGGIVILDFNASHFDTDTLFRNTEIYTVEIDYGEGWTGVVSTSAYGAEDYNVLVTTPFDSSATSNGLINFRVIAAMEEGNWVSEPDSGYSLDNIAPAVPTGLMATAISDSINLVWDMSVEDDFHYYVLEKSTEQEFANYETIHTIENVYNDTECELNLTYYYRLSVADYSGNISEYSETVEATVLSIDGDLIPVEFALRQNYPNPFNPVTTLRYDLPENGHVNITIYNMLGREVKTLMDQTQDAGYRSIIWDATNDYGKPVSAGIYLYQIQAGEYISTKKMVLLK